MQGERTGGGPALEGLDEAYRRHLLPIWRYARARLPTDVDADDVTSDVFLRAARSWTRFDPGRASAGAWLAGIARHAVADWWRHRREAPAAADQLPETTAAGGPEEAVVDADDIDRIRRHLHVLTEREQDAVALRFGAGLASAEVGTALGISDAGARMLVHRAMAKLREALGDA